MNPRPAAGRHGWYSRAVGDPPCTLKTGAHCGRRRRGAAARTLLCVAASVAALAVALSAGARPAGANAPLAAAKAQVSGRSWADRTPVPILMYHHVQVHRDGAPAMYVSPRQFRRQLAYLRSHGYHPVALSRVWRAWNGEGTLPPRPVVLSFDDGYIDQYANAARILRPYHWSAVLNLVVDRGTTLTDAKVRRMVAWGWQIGSHTMDHKVLTRLSPSRLRYQLAQSRRVLRGRFHQQVDFLCYPYGESGGRVERAAQEAGYLAATGVKYGAAVPQRRWALRRVAVWWGEPLAEFGKRMRDAVARAR